MKTTEGNKNTKTRTALTMKSTADKSTTAIAKSTKTN